MLGNKSVKALTYAPLPVPSDVCESAIVGFWDVLQQTPFSSISAPPLSVTVPPEIALLEVTEVIGIVTTVGATTACSVVKFRTSVFIKFIPFEYLK